MVEQLLESRHLQRVLTAEEMREMLEVMLAPGIAGPARIGAFPPPPVPAHLLRDVLGLGTLPEITGELSGWPTRSWNAYRAHPSGSGCRATASRSREAGARVAFRRDRAGKTGRQELNYSSDIDLMFLYYGQRRDRRRADAFPTKNSSRSAAINYTALLSTYTAEGMCYRVDLRLRPDGSQGEVCISLEGARQYYAIAARDWELQMMIKARVAAGDRATGRGSAGLRRAADLFDHARLLAPSKQFRKRASASMKS